MRVFLVQNFLKHGENYDLLWNSGLIQCLSPDEQKKLIEHATKLSKRLLLFYPDTDSPGKICGNDSSRVPGVSNAVEYSVASLPILFCSYYDNVYMGRIPAKKLALPYDMLWLQGDNPCE
ncbi:hypothetical protein [Geobacter sp. OR-1]|uniref:hypothetical protein n=1 Tax=Geobacter sp. OR-1 TaxID=1266765 RepID=UPI000ABD7464|nr:hypothetical protein [Geobacter sp. OR-1]